MLNEIQIYWNIFCDETWGFFIFNKFINKTIFCMNQNENMCIIKNNVMFSLFDWIGYYYISDIFINKLYRYTCTQVKNIELIKVMQFNIFLICLTLRVHGNFFLEKKNNKIVTH